MSQGWIKLHRAIEDNPRFRDAKWLQVWIKCLLMATHRAYKTVFDGKVIELKPGQFITSRKTLARETDTHESRVERILKTLEIEQQIEQVGGVTSRLITVTKWEQYQDGEQDGEQRPNNQRTAGEQPANTNKNGKNDKKGKKKVEGAEASAEAQSLFQEPDNIQATKETLRAAAACALLENPEFAEAWDAFLAMRREIKKPAGDRAQKIILKSLEKYPIDIAIRMVDESTVQNWRGVFPLKEGQYGQAGSRGGNRRESRAERLDRDAAELLSEYRGAQGGNPPADQPDFSVCEPGEARA